jgi:hypothetical protein
MLADMAARDLVEEMATKRKGTNDLVQYRKLALGDP